MGPCSKRVCADCLNDAFLAEVVEPGTSCRECDYCGTPSDTAALASIVPVVAKAIGRHYEPCGRPEGETAVAGPGSSLDVLRGLRWAGNPRLLTDVANELGSDYWASLPSLETEPRSGELLDWSWLHFERVVKHESRFNFHTTTKPQVEGVLDAGAVLRRIGEVVVAHGLVQRTQPKALYRARSRRPQDVWDAHCPAELGAPPKEKAGAGRMNPAGIPYLYTAFEPATAIGEIAFPLPGLPIDVVLATFEANRELLVLDLSLVEPPRSVFDCGSPPVDDRLEFLARFARDLALPVVKDGSEHIDYIPSQVVSEYFAQVFLPNGPDSAPLDGLVHRSSVCPGGRNLVLFPSRRQFTSNKFGSVSHVGAEVLRFRDWRHLSRAVAPRAEAAGDRPPSDGRFK